MCLVNNFPDEPVCSSIGSIAEDKMKNYIYMKRKVFIRQDGTIPGESIIEELVKTGVSNPYLHWIFRKEYIFYTDFEDGCIRYSVEWNNNNDEEDYTELLYDHSTNSFYEKSKTEESISPQPKKLPGEKKVYKFKIPENYDACIEGNEIILNRKGEWKPTEGKTYWTIVFFYDTLKFTPQKCMYWNTRNEDLFFQSYVEARDLCDKLNKNIIEIIKKFKNSNSD